MGYIDSRNLRTCTCTKPHTSSITCEECGGVHVTYNVRKYASLIPVSADLLADGLAYMGPIAPPITPTHMQRLRWWASRNVAEMRYKIGSWIAGADLRQDDDY